MSSSIDIQGSLTIGGSGSCGPTGGCNPAGAADSTIRALGDLCGGKTYDEVYATTKAVQISTLGAIGSAFEDLPVGQDLERVEFLMLHSSAEMALRIGAEEAVLLGSGGVFPTTFAGGETLILVVDGGAPVTVTFDAADQTADDCALRINAALALAGYATPRASVVGGQLSISSQLAGASGSVSVTGGTGAATLGLSGEAMGAGEEVRFSGLLMIEFPRNENAPGRLQISGSGTLSAVVGGR